MEALYQYYYAWVTDTPPTDFTPISVSSHTTQTVCHTRRHCLQIAQ